MLQYAIDDLYAGVTRSKLAFYAGVLLLIAGLAGYFRYQMRRIIISASRGFEYDLRNDFFAHLERLPVSFFQQNRTGDLMSRATNDLSSVRMMVGPAVMYLANTLITAVVSLSLMFSLDVRLTLIVLLPLPIVSITVKMFGTAIHKTFEEVQEKLSDMSAVVQESLTGVRVVRAYRQEEAEIARFREANIDYLRHNKRLSRLQGAFFPTMSLFLGISALLALWLGSRDVMSGRLTVGELVAFNAYLAQLAWPMIAFGWVTNLLERGMASWKRMLTVMETVPAVVMTRTGEGIRDWGSGIRAVTGITRARGDRISEPELPLRQSRSAQQRLVLGEGGRDGRHRRRHGIGQIDAGQSAAAPAEPSAGVRCSSTDAMSATFRSASCAASIGFVPQEPFLFSDTLADNVAFGVPGVKQDAAARIEAAAIGRPARQGRSRLPARLRDDGRRARHHAVGRAEAAHRHRARRRHRSAHSDSG